MASKSIKIDHNTIVKEFSNHLDIKDNDRILFTAPYGAGKSTFLQEVFEKSESYFAIKLFPVNYSVAINEDVFELIKFDLLMQLMGHYNEEIDLRKEDFTFLLRSQFFIMERMRFMPLLYALIGLSDKVGQPVTDLIKAIESTGENFENFSKEIKADETKIITQYLNSIENTKGNIHESDAISQLIYDLIDRVKKNRNKPEELEVKSVLIIDDLDRLDPEHIFRLFNIFSVHYQNQLKNKFGFDKVIFVCDIENIRKIFHHRYGVGVDFAGYIDKFYSLLPFEFDNRQYIKNQIDSIIHQIKLSNNIEYLNFKINNRFSDCVISVVNSLIDSRALSLRMLLNYPQLKIPEIKFRKGKFTRLAHDTPIIVLFFLLKNFYGSFDILNQKLKFLATTSDKNSLSSYGNRISYDDGSYQIVLSYCLPFILPEEFSFEEIGEREETVTYSSKYNCFLRYTGFSNRYTAFKNFIRATETKEDNSKEIFINPFEVLLDSFENIRKVAILI